MFVIGVAGQAQMGKDTLADRLRDKLNESGISCETQSLDIIWERSAFAANVKKVYCDTFGVDLDFIEKWKTVPECPPGFDMPVRQALQFIGDGFRKIKSTIWLDLAFRDKKPKIISDVRYINEFLRVKQEGGLAILIGRTDKLNDDQNGSEAQIRPYIDWALRNQTSDASSIATVKDMLFANAAREALGGGIQEAPPENMDKFDVFVRNDSSKEDLYKLIDDQLVPYVRNYVFDFPSAVDGEKVEEKCLISN